MQSNELREKINIIFQNLLTDIILFHIDIYSLSKCNAPQTTAQLIS